MGDLNRGQLREEIKANLGRGGVVSDDISDGRYHRHIELAEKRIARLFPWQELNIIYNTDVTLTGTALVDKQREIPYEVREIQSVSIIWDGEQFRVVWLHPRTWDKAFGDPEETTSRASQRPTHYTTFLTGTSETGGAIRGRVTLFWSHIPSQNYTLIVRLSRWPGPLVLDSQKPTLVQKDDAIIALATSTLFHSTGNREDGNTYYGFFRDMIDSAIREEAKQTDQYMRPTGDSETDVSLDTPWADPFVRRWT